MIQRILKIVVAIGIFFCMFIPLSQCTYTPLELVEESSSETTSVLGGEPETKVLIISERLPDLELIAIWVPLTFIVPLIFSIPFQQRRKRFIIIQSLQSLYVLWLCYFIYATVYGFYEPLTGGYLLTGLAITFGLLTAIEWYKYVKKI